MSSVGEVVVKLSTLDGVPERISLPHLDSLIVALQVLQRSESECLGLRLVVGPGFTVYIERG